MIRKSVKNVRVRTCPKFVSVSALAGLVALPAAAQQATNAPVKLPEVVVTATRYAEVPEKTATTVSVVTREEIEDRKLTTLAEALETVTGLTVVRNGSPGQVTSVFSRGTAGKHTLLTIDGRTQPPILTGGYDYATLSLDNVRQIEVVRTPSSSLYGGNSIGGVINVITLNGRGLAKPESEVSFEGGSFDTFRETAASRGAFGKFDYAVAASQLNASYPRANNRYRETTFRTSTGYEVDKDLYVDLKSSYLQADGGSPGSTSFPSLTDHLKREYVNVSPGVVWQAAEKLETKVYYSYDHQYLTDLSFGATTGLTIAGHQVEWQNNLQVLENWRLTAGLAFRNTSFERVTGSVPNIDANQTTVGGFLQSTWTPVERLSVINSVRYDHYSAYAPGFTWRQGASFKVPVTESVVFANVSRSYSPPTAADLYFPGYSNPNLRPESSFGLEAGVEQSFHKDQVKVSATVFQNKIDDLIQSPAPTYRPMNVAKATTEGVELAVKYAPCKSFSAESSYTYLTATDDLNHQRLVRRPRQQFNASLTLKPIEKLTLSSGVSWVMQRQDVDFPPPTYAATNVPLRDYLLLRASVTYQATKNLQLWLRGENLTDYRFEPVLGYPALRAGAYAGLKVTF